MSGAPAGRRRRLVSAGERALWRFAVRDAEPLAGRAPDPAPAPEKQAAAVLPPPPAAVAAPAPTKPMPKPIALPMLGHRSTPGLDARTSERLKRGQLPIEGRLDLHGLTQDEARRALDGFIAEAYAKGRRAVLIITGKGLKPRHDYEDPWHGAGRGILKQATPRWLNEAPNRARVLAFTEAQARHGGSGALYVLIRRQRE
ncbi:MAG TPA: Smr/MutS family protein [Aliidongia sp.]|nr:Smr/MutS family protein [Aliidongia sp.]